MSSASRLALPTRKRTYRFALTPFADAMFQLLIFFMLSSSLTPYSLLTLQTGTPDAETSTAAGNDPAAAAAPPPQPAGVPQDVALWTIEAGTVRVVAAWAPKAGGGSELHMLLQGPPGQLVALGVSPNGRRRTAPVGVFRIPPSGFLELGAVLSQSTTSRLDQLTFLIVALPEPPQ